MLRRSAKMEAAIFVAMVCCEEVWSLISPNPSKPIRPMNVMATTEIAMTTSSSEKPFCGMGLNPSARLLNGDGH